MTEIDLSGKRLIVTGASTGIGRSIAVALAAAGADVAVHYSTSRAEAERTAEQIRGKGAKAILVQGDFREEGSTTAAIEAAVDGLGAPIDGLVNNAGSLLKRASVEEMGGDLWRQVIDLNLSSVFFATRAALPHLANGGAIVNVGSIAGRNGGGPGAFAYAAAKGAVSSLTRGLAKELAPRGIRVNAIAPGVIDTPFHERFSTPEMLATFKGGIPLGRLGTGDDCAGAVLFLVSPLAAYITGQTIDVNGGQWFA